MIDEAYRVAGWIKRPSLERPYWAEFGDYPTLEAAHRASQAVAAPGFTIRISRNGQTLATYQDRELVTNGEPVKP